jgi:NAD+ diphosphatase
MEEIYCFAGNPLDRVSERRRDAGWIASLLEEPTTRLIPLRDLKPSIRNGGEMALEWQAVGPWREVIAGGATLAFLGIAEGCAHFVLDVTSADQPPDPAVENIDVRTLAPLIAGPEAAILAEARSVVDWHARHRFCAQCGTPSEVASGGWARHCPSCKAHHFPRVDPVVIMLAVKGERALLGRGHRRPGARFSCLAGYMEPGETLEDAVRREVREESGIRCGRIRYLASQPWPFPSTLMIGFLAEALSEEITVDPEELVEARWFERHEIRDMVTRAAAGDPDPATTVPSLPGPVAVAHQICRRWANGIDSL